MKSRYLVIAVIAAAAFVGGLILWGQSSSAAGKHVVGAWFVTFPDAPFKYHMVTFHADGTMQQANPDAGNANTSDSDGMGVWEIRSGKVVGKFVEVTADRATRQFVSRGEISFTFDVEGTRLSGTATGRFYDLNEKLVFGPVNTGMTGMKIGL